MILLSAGLVSGLCFTAADRINREVKIPKYDLSIRPGRVTYGTVSRAAVPMVSVATPRSSMPMVSGGTVRAYAHSGHATMPVMSSHRGAGYSAGYKLYTVSSAKVHSIGGGGAGGGGATGGSSSSSSSSNIQYSSSYATVSMPSLALASSVSSSSSARAATVATLATAPSSDLAAASPRLNRGIRRAKPTYDGTGGQEVEDESETWYWDEEEGDWVNVTPVGTVRENGGYYEEWNGSTWVRKEQVPDLGTPIGSTPWLLFLLLSLAYVLFKRPYRINRLTA